MNINSIELIKNIKYSDIRSFIPVSFRKINFWIIFSIILGIVIRLVQYLHNRSLYMDDAELALNIVSRSFFQLLKPLDYDQGAPFGFLAITKLFTILFGNNEFALRLFPLVTGILSLFLLYYLSREYLSPFGVLIAVGLFSLAEPLYYYATAFKQYSSDVFFSILILFLFTKLKTKGTSISNLVLFSFVGAVIIWFSFSSVFVLAGIGVIGLFYFLKRNDWKSFLKVTLVSSIWLISFAVYYFSTSLYTLSHSSYMQEFWNNAFMPGPSLSFNYIKWLINSFFDIFTFIMNYETSALAGSFFILGLIGFHRKNKPAFYIFILPVIITLIVSCFHLYPFSGRLILFLIPTLLIFIAKGLEMLKTSTMPHKLVFIIPTILLLFYPSYNAALNLHKPIEKDEIKQALGYLSKNIQQGDVIYLYNKSISTFDFYKNKYNLDNYPVVNGIYTRNDWKEYLYNLNQLKGKKRVWVLITHFNEDTDDRVLILAYLDSIGIRKNFFKAEGAELYLYDLSMNNSKDKFKIFIKQTGKPGDQNKTL